VIRKVDRYELLEEVGSGGMAAVYRGRDTALEREVAVKLLHPHLAARAESRARFSREARAVARLAHPGIVEIFDYSGDAALESWLVTEFVHGRTLRAFADAVGFGFPEVGMLVGRALADALAHAHAAGVIHRDLKPENVLVCETGVRRAVKLADFGIARLLAADEHMTMTGALVGSPNHMAPEIVEGGGADARSDVFSLGTLLYWMATGVLPFAAPNPTAVLRRVIEGDQQDPRELSPLVSGPLAALLARTLAHDPAVRPQGAAELRDELDALLAESRLDAPEDELAAFLADPAAYKAALSPRLVAAYRARGEAALAADDRATALSFFDQVLALDPGDPAVLGHLARLGRRTRLRRAAAIGAAGLLLLCAAVATVAGVRSIRQDRRQRAQVAARARAATAAQPPSPAGATSHQGAGAVSPHAVREIAPPAPPPVAPAPRRPAPRPVEVSVHVRPYAQRALLDGVEVAEGAQRITFQLNPGQRHRIEIVHACCFPFVRDLEPTPGAAPVELKVPLQPRPAALRVEGDPAARVFLDDQLLGSAGDSQRTAFAVLPPAGENPYEGQGRLRIELAGREPYLTTIKIRAAGEISVAAPTSEPTP
jgi:serine/threonine-protein kinase